MKNPLFAVAVVAALGNVGSAPAQSYPTRPITILVPYPVGGPTDVIGRMVAERMRASLGQPVIIENLAGASGSIGTGRGARAAGDGYTLSIGLWNTHVANGAFYALQYDLQKDFEPIALISSNPLLIVAKKTMQARDLKELVAWLKVNPDQATQGSSGVGSAAHIAGVLFQRETGTRFQHVPYRGTAPAMQDLVAGTNRHADHRPGHFPAAGARRHHQGLCRHCQEPLGSSA